VIATALALSATAASAQSRAYYYASGRFAGSSVTRGNGASFYDSRGRYQGSSAPGGHWDRSADLRGNLRSNRAGHDTGRS